MAVDSANSLYALIYNPDIIAQTINVYSADSNKVERAITVTTGATSLTIMALVVDSGGYLYVGYAATEVVRGQFVYWSGVWIFAPDANGYATPVQTITISTYSAYVTTAVSGLALDRGNLLVSTNGSTKEVLTYQTPVTNPTLIRTLTGYGLPNPYGIAVDAGELYVSNGYFESGPMFVAAYPVDANGSPNPDREIAIYGQKSVGLGGIAVKANRLFVPDLLAGAVYEVDATKGGTQQPIATLRVRGAMDVKLGR